MEVVKSERIILKHRLNRLSPCTNVSYNNGKNVDTGRKQATALRLTVKLDIVQACYRWCTNQQTDRKLTAAELCITLNTCCNMQLHLEEDEGQVNAHSILSIRQTKYVGLLVG